MVEFRVHRYVVSVSLLAAAFYVARLLRLNRRRANVGDVDADLIEQDRSSDDRAVDGGRIMRNGGTVPDSFTGATRSGL